MNFWDSHALLFIIAMFFFPRLTMLFATSYGGGLLYWLGWFFCPRFTVAIIATILYHDANSVLVILTWLWCFCGEGLEKSVASEGVLTVYI
jgi:hypothetical protein